MALVRALCGRLLCAAATAQDIDVAFVVTPDNVTREMLKLADVEAPDKPIGREKTSRLHLWIVR